jgi:hypothetical protein
MARGREGAIGALAERHSSEYLLFSAHTVLLLVDIRYYKDITAFENGLTVFCGISISSGHVLTDCEDVCFSYECYVSDDPIIFHHMKSFLLISTHSFMCEGFLR